MGAMVEAHQLSFNLHLARHNIWCHASTCHSRPTSFFPAEDFDTIRKLVQAKRFDRIDELFQEACAKNDSRYMLWPAARLRIQPDEAEIELAGWSRKLDMKNAACHLRYRTRQRQAANCFIASSDYDVVAVRMQCRTRQLPYRVKAVLEANAQKEGVRTQFSADRRTKSVFMHVSGGNALPDYVVGVRVDGPGCSASAGARQACLGVRSSHGEPMTCLYAAIASSLDGPDPLKETRRRLAVAAKDGFDAINRKHRAGWRAFWKRAGVLLPDDRIQRQHNLGMYLLASCSRPGRRAPGLQGLWAFKEGGSGWNDYTNDFNSQAHFWPAYTGNQLHLAQPYYETFRKMMPQVRRDTKKYYGARGVFYPCACSPQGHAAPGYVTHFHTAGNSAFIAQNYYRGYLYTLDETFLRETAYPVMKECALFYLDRVDTEKDSAVINASTSPEEGEGSYEAWGVNPTMDIALVKELLEATIAASTVLGCDPALRAEWQELLDKAPGYPTRNGYLIEMRGREFKGSHRHVTVLAPIWPCEDLVRIGDGASRRLAEASFERFLDRGRWAWAGYTYPWVALIAARLGQGNRAAGFLGEFIGVACLDCGGLHMNADFTGSMKMATGEKNFTLEGNTMYSAAVFEMLLQSHGEVIQVFPAVPDGWEDVSFENLRARGAFLVSARRKGGKTREVTIRSLAGACCRLLNPFGSERVVVRRRRAGRSVKIEVSTEGKFVVFETVKNGRYTVRRER